VDQLVKVVKREDTVLMKTTIVFRGLMVLHKHLDTMEIGFVNALYDPSEEHNHNGAPAHAGHAVNHDAHPPLHSESHIPRILKTKNGVLSEIFDLRNRPELGTVRNWSLVVTNPVASEATLLERGPFNRATPAPGTDERDFRWITDMEAADLHGRDLSLDINTRQFLFVLYVRHGLFYTRLKSPVLRRRRLDPMRVEPYGATAAVVGCDIELSPGGGVQLIAGGSDGSIVYDFDHDEDTVYEISNGPPDVPAEEPTSLDAQGHFHMYYDKLFKNRRPDQFDLLTEDRAPAPDPTLCGVTYLGLRGDPL
jgi:hypothetical protein